MHHRPSAAVALASALSLALLAGCGGDDRSAADSVRADSTVLGPPVGDPAVKSAADDSIAAAAARRDSAGDRGMTPMDGIDSAARGGAASAANDSGRRIPGVPVMKARPGATTGPGARRP